MKIRSLLSVIISILFLTTAIKAQPSIAGVQHSMGGSDDEDIRNIIQDSENDIIISANVRSADGYIRSFHGGIDIWIVKIDHATGDTLWTTRAFGSPGTDQGSALELSDSNYIVVNTSSSPGGDVIGHHLGTGNDLWFMKLNRHTGDTMWLSRCYGGNHVEGYDALFNTSDGNFLVAGGSRSSDGDIRQPHGNDDFWVFKLDIMTGDTIWMSRALGGNHIDRIAVAFETSDNQILLFGETRTATSSSTNGDVTGYHFGMNRSDFWTIKLDGNTGDTIWTSKGLGGTNTESPRHAFESTDGNYILIGNTLSSDGDVRGHHGSSDFWAVKLNSSTGDTIWTSRAVGGSGSELVEQVVETSDGNFIVATTTISTNGDVKNNHGAQDIWLVKFSSLTGDTIWTTTIGGSDRETIATIFEDSNEDLVIGATSESVDGDVNGGHGEEDFWIVKVDANTGEIILSSDALGGYEEDSWDNSPYFSGSGRIEEGCNGGYLLSGETMTVTQDGDVWQNSPAGTIRSMWMIKLDDNFDLEWSKVWSDGQSATKGYAFSADDGGYIMIGHSHQTSVLGDKTVIGNGGGDIWTSKINWIEAGFEIDSICGKSIVAFSDTSIGEIDHWNWNFGDGNTSLSQNPSNFYTAVDSYTVSLTINKECEWDTAIQSIYIDSVLGLPSASLPADTVLCPGPIDITLEAGDSTYNYVWSTGDTTNTITINQVGLYSVIATGDCNYTDSTSINITQVPNKDIIVTSDTAICSGQEVILAAISMGKSYTWEPSALIEEQSGESATIVSNENAIVFLNMTDSNNCVFKDSVQIEALPCNVFVPNAISFSTNDQLKVLNTDGVDKINWSIYNLSGLQLFESTTVNEHWDGQYKGKTIQQGVYLSKCSITYKNNVTYQVITNITVI